MLHICFISSDENCLCLVTGAEMAVAKINSDPMILPDHELVLLKEDTQCIVDIAMKHFVQFVGNKTHPIVGILGKKLMVMMMMTMVLMVVMMMMMIAHYLKYSLNFTRNYRFLGILVCFCNIYFFLFNDILSLLMYVYVFMCMYRDVILCC